MQVAQVLLIRRLAQHRKAEGGGALSLPTPCILGRLTQLVRVPALQAGCHWFESGIAHHIKRYGQNDLGRFSSKSLCPFFVFANEVD